MTVALTRKQVASIAFGDALAVTLILLVPALSHLVAVPLHAFEPMRIALFSVVLFLPQRKWNAIFLAVLLPLVSFVVSGHPIFPKNLIMSAELAINVVLFYIFLSKTGKYSVSILLSMLLSKFLYYIIKYLLIMGGVLDMQLFSTCVWFQVVLVLFFTLAFFINDNKQRTNG